MKALVRGALLGAVFLTACATWAMRPRGAQPAALPPRATPVVVELFSSEGCSSCPPADRYLAQLDREQPVPGVAVIALEHHVDYWDRLGWKDPYGSPRATARQRLYAAVLEDHRTFTPEIVVQGSGLLQGGDEEQARRLIEEAARNVRTTVTISRRGALLAVDVQSLDTVSAEDTAEVWLAITESGIVSDVDRGENAGRSLAHAPVVRRLSRLGVVRDGAYRAEVPVELDAGWKPAALRMVVLVQEARSRRILGAGAV